MHSTVKYLCSIAGLATAFILVASQVNAQSATFTLPFPAHVGNTTLPPGDYRLRVNATGTPMPAAYLYSNGQLVASAGVLRQMTQDASGSYLEFLSIGDSHYVSKFVSSETGAIFTFFIPSAARHQILADARASGLSVNHAASN